MAYKLQTMGWQVGEAFEDGYDLLAFHPQHNKVCRIEVKTMDISNRSEGVNLTAPVSLTERKVCTHIIVYVEPHGWYFVAKKEHILTPSGNIFAAIDRNGTLRTPKKRSKSFVPFQDAWDELLR